MFPAPILSQLKPLRAWLNRNAAALLTVRLAVAVITIAFSPLLPEGLQYDRSAILNGQVWRLLTGHLTHWNFDHLCWDLLMFVVLGAIVANWKRWLMTVVGSAAAISAVLWFSQPEIATYRGLSGVDTGLFVVALATVFHRAKANKDTAILALTATLAIGLSAKLLYEATTGHCLFVDDQSAHFTPLVSAHITGALTGISVLAAEYLSAKWKGRSHNPAQVFAA